MSRIDTESAHILLQEYHRAQMDMRQQAKERLANQYASGIQALTEYILENHAVFRHILKPFYGAHETHDHRLPHLVTHFWERETTREENLSGALRNLGTTRAIGALLLFSESDAYDQVSLRVFSKYVEPESVGSFEFLVGHCPLSHDLSTAYELRPVKEIDSSIVVAGNEVYSHHFESPSAVLNLLSRMNVIDYTPPTVVVQNAWSGVNDTLIEGLAGVGCNSFTDQDMHATLNRAGRYISSFISPQLRLP